MSEFQNSILRLSDCVEIIYAFTLDYLNSQKSRHRKFAGIITYFEKNTSAITPQKAEGIFLALKQHGILFSLPKQIINVALKYIRHYIYEFDERRNRSIIISLNMISSNIYPDLLPEYLKLSYNYYQIDSGYSKKYLETIKTFLDGIVISMPGSYILINSELLKARQIIENYTGEHRVLVSEIIVLLENKLKASNESIATSEQSIETPEMIKAKRIRLNIILLLVFIPLSLFILFFANTKWETNKPINALLVSAICFVIFVFIEYRINKLFNKDVRSKAMKYASTIAALLMAFFINIISSYYTPADKVDTPPDKTDTTTEVPKKP